MPGGRGRDPSFGAGHILISVMTQAAAVVGAAGAARLTPAPVPPSTGPAL